MMYLTGSNYFHIVVYVEWLVVGGGSGVQYIIRIMYIYYL